MSYPFIVGQKYHPGYQVYMSIASNFKSSFINNEYYSIVLIEKGSCIIKIGNSVYPVTAPAILSINEVEKLEFIQQENLYGKIIYFHPKVINIAFDFEVVQKGYDFLANTTEQQDFFLLNPFIDRQDGAKGILAIGPIIASHFNRLICNLSEELTEQNNKFWPCRSRSFLLEILCLLSKIFLEPNSINEITFISDEQDHYSLLLYIHTQYSKKLTLKELCGQFHTNRTTLQERFLRLTGKSIMVYLQELRLQISSTMLRDTTIPISEIAKRTGYSDLNHFSRSFRLKMGLSPSDYRQKTNWLLN